MAFVFAACANGHQKRIDAKKGLFDSYPPEIQKDIRDRQVRVGFTEDMVYMALGRPAAKGKRTTDKGEEETWVYSDEKRRSRPGLGLSIGTGGHGMAGGISIGSSGVEVEKLRVVFRDGKVVSVEERQP